MFVKLTLISSFLTQRNPEERFRLGLVEALVECCVYVSASAREWDDGVRKHPCTHGRCRGAKVDIFYVFLWKGDFRSVPLPDPVPNAPIFIHYYMHYGVHSTIRYMLPITTKSAITSS